MKRIIVFTLLFLSIPFVSFADDIDHYIDMLPDELVEDYDGTVYVVESLGEYNGFVVYGEFYKDSKDIYVVASHPEYIIHELMHYAYYSCDISKELADALYDAKQWYRIRGYDDLNRYDYDSEIVSFMVQDYFMGNLNKFEKPIAERIIQSLIKSKKEVEYEKIP